MTYHWTVPLLAALANLCLAIMVYRTDRSSRVRQVFCFLSTMLVFWNLHAFVLYFVKDIRLAFALSRVLRSASLLMAPAFAHIALSVKERTPRYSRAVLALDYGVGIALIAANSFDLLVARLEPDSRGFHSVGTSVYHVFTALLIANVCLAIGYLVHEYLTSTSPQRREQLRFWLLGAIVALPFGLTNLLPAYGVPFYPLGNLGSTAWAGIVAYAIVRHRFMDIDVVVTKGVSYAAVAFGLIAPVFGLTLWLQRLAFGHVHFDFSFAMLLMFVAVGLLFPNLRSRAESRLEKSLFREKHEYRSALVAFTRSIVRILDRDKLLHELGTTLAETLRLDRIAIALMDETKRVFTVQDVVGTASAIEEFPEGHAFVGALARCQEAALREELEASADAAERAVVADVCRRNGWEVCIPLIIGGKLIGFIGLGRKRNLEAYFAEDLELLGTLGAEASVALENARLYEELRRSQEIIQRADRLSALGTLAAGIAHEVRNPLVAIQTFFQLAPERLHDEEFFSTFLTMTAEEVKRISKLITELLTFARSPTRSLGPVDLNETVERVGTLIEPEARKHRLALTHTLSPDVPLVYADGDQIRQLLLNLLLNAIQATEPGGAIRITSRPVQHHDTPFCQLEISDTGVGIPQNRLDDIFTPFFTTKDKGTGLGLAIAHQIVAEHGGFISVDSKEGQGTSFFIDLPAYDQAIARKGRLGEGMESESLPRRHGRARQLAS